MNRRLPLLSKSLATIFAFVSLTLSLPLSAADKAKDADGPRKFEPVKFSVRSVASGNWSDPKTWEPARVPKGGDLVQVARGTRVVYDVKSDEVLRLVQVVGTLTFSREKDTLLNVAVVKVQNSDACSEAGFACDFADVTESGEPYVAPNGPMPALEIGTPDNPIPVGRTAKIRLHYLAGLNEKDAPAIACCAGRFDVHGAPLSRAWVKLGKDIAPGDNQIVLGEDVSGWQAGDEVLVTASLHEYQGGKFRQDPSLRASETRKITAIDNNTLTLDKPLDKKHFGSGEFRSEAANLSRNVVIESADPKGHRGHTMYHQFSRGSLSYARFSHLGKENTLGRYPIHFHLCGDTMRGASVVGVVIDDSHNRWITVHGTNHMLIRDCIGFASVGHGFFLEDGTEVYTVFDHNLGVGAMHGKPLPKQVLPFDPNDGAAFWWANGRNTFIRNTSCENDEYGYRYDSQKRSNFDSNLSVKLPSGQEEKIDIRTLPIFRFEKNEAHSEGLYGIAVAGTDRVGPDRRHPHVLKDTSIWQVHYGLRTQLPTMLIENVRMDHAVYGVYRPEFIDHVYRNLDFSYVSSEPFNRGIDDESLQNGSITVDGLSFRGANRGDGIPNIQMSDNNPSGTAESHFKNVKTPDRKADDRRALVDRGGGAVVEPKTSTSVPVYLHDYYGPGRHAKIVSTHSKDFDKSDPSYREEKPLTGRDSRVKEVADVSFPQLLDPVDDLPPATAITWPLVGHTARLEGNDLVVRGVSTDNVKTKQVLVNGVPARNLDFDFHVWEARLTGVKPGPLTITAVAEDAAGNVEQDGHKIVVEVK